MSTVTVRFSVTALVVAVFAGACSDSKATGTSESVDPAGLWRFDLVQTVTTGVCASEVGDTGFELITITKTGSAPPYQVVASGFLGDPNNQLTGTFDAKNKLVISGTYPEEGGTLVTSHTLTATSANKMTGTETWTWTGGGGSCPNSKASVTATRQ